MRSPWEGVTISNLESQDMVLQHPRDVKSRPAYNALDHSLDRYIRKLPQTRSNVPPPPLPSLLPHLLPFPSFCFVMCVYIYDR
ncbi:hypothetical protein FKM82_009908 [Ascaphus truei]